MKHAEPGKCAYAHWLAGVIRAVCFAQEVPNEAWEAHKYISYGDTGKGVANQILLYGQPKSLEEFCDLAQIANYVQYRCNAII